MAMTYERMSAQDDSAPEQPHPLVLDQKVLLPWQALEMAEFSEYGPQIALYRAMAGNEGYYISLKDDSYLVVTYEGDFQHLS